jgi:hypothetical protein
MPTSDRFVQHHVAEPAWNIPVFLVSAYECEQYSRIGPYDRLSHAKPLST